MTKHQEKTFVHSFNSAMKLIFLCKEALPKLFSYHHHKSFLWVCCWRKTQFYGIHKMNTWTTLCSTEQQFVYFIVPICCNTFMGHFYKEKQSEVLRSYFYQNAKKDSRKMLKSQISVPESLSLVILTKVMC